MDVACLSMVQENNRQICNDRQSADGSEDICGANRTHTQSYANRYADDFRLCFKWSENSIKHEKEMNYIGSNIITPKRFDLNLSKPRSHIRRRFWVARPPGKPEIATTHI